MASAISISSNGLSLLGHTAIASFTEDSAGAVIAAALYEGTYLSMLENHRWRFATKKAQLARFSEAPLNDFQYKFAIPADSLYVQRTSTHNYEIYDDAIYANEAELSIDYTYRVEEDKLPPSFVKTLEFLLASQFAVPITGDLNKTDMYYKMYKDQLSKAKHTDSTQRPNAGIQDARYVDTRY